jgi:hypothetical protein
VHFFVDLAVFFVFNFLQAGFLVVRLFFFVSNWKFFLDSLRCCFRSLHPGVCQDLTDWKSLVGFISEHIGYQVLEVIRKCDIRSVTLAYWPKFLDVAIDDVLIYLILLLSAFKGRQSRVHHVERYSESEKVSFFCLVFLVTDDLRGHVPFRPKIGVRII